MLEIGSLVDGKYKILNVVGRGGMSVVYLAMNEKANKQWAIKEVRKDGTKDFEVVKQGLVVEIGMLKRLSHPNLPSIVDVIEDDDTFLIVMDYIQGNPLSKTLEEFGAQPQEYVIEWAKQLCDVLGYLHNSTPPIVYRDMKPANVMLKPDGNVSLIDFGTAREFKEKNLADTTCLGTIGYAAPEQFGGMGQTDARTDIYCLGATLYHLVTGMNPSDPPYEIKPIREINPGLSSGLERIILKCTQRDPEDRYQSTAELMYALEHYDEIDDLYRKKQKKRLFAFIATLTASALFAGASAWSNSQAQSLKKANYDFILLNAQSVDDYYEAILTDSSRTEGYLGLAEFLVQDGEMSSEEAGIIRKLQGGLDQQDGRGYTTAVDVLSQLQAANPDGYAEVCYSFGETYLFYYNVGVEKDRYVNAAEWFGRTIDRYPISQVYCNIASCLNKITQYKNAKVTQLSKIYEEYASLWIEISGLYDKSAEYEDMDSKLQVWNIIVDIILNNSDMFTDIIDSSELVTLLDKIQAETENINQAVLDDIIAELHKHIADAKAKIATKKE